MLDFGHILESSLGLTVGGLLLKLIDKTCKSNCGNSQPVTTIQPDTESETELSDNVSEITQIPEYDINNNVYHNNGNHNQEISQT